MREKNFNLIGLPGPMEEFCTHIGWMVFCLYIVCGGLVMIRSIDKRKDKK